MPVLENVIALVIEKLQIIRVGVELVQLEARLAGMSIIPLFITIGFLIVVIPTCWLVGMGLLGYGIFAVSQSVLVSLVGTLVLNALLILLLLYSLSNNLRNMSFVKTRLFLAKRKQEHAHDYEKKCTEGHSSNQQETTLASSESE